MMSKTWLTDLIKIQGVVKNVKNIGTVIDDATILSLAAAIDGLN